MPARVSPAQTASLPVAQTLGPRMSLFLKSPRGCEQGQVLTILVQVPPPGLGGGELALEEVPGVEAFEEGSPLCQA